MFAMQLQNVYGELPFLHNKLGKIKELFLYLILPFKFVKKSCFIAKSDTYLKKSVYVIFFTNLYQIILMFKTLIGSSIMRTHNIYKIAFLRILGKNMAASSIFFASSFYFEKVLRCKNNTLWFHLILYSCFINQIFCFQFYYQ